MKSFNLDFKYLERLLKTDDGAGGKSLQVIGLHASDLKWLGKIKPGLLITKGKKTSCQLLT